MMNDLILSMEYLKRRAYVMFCCKLAKFFNRKILHFKFVPRWFPVVSRYHKLHVILLFIIEWVDAHKDHTYVICMYVWLKHISWYNQGINATKLRENLRRWWQTRKKDVTYQNNMLDVVHVHSVFHCIQDLIDVWTSVKTHEIQRKRLKTIGKIFENALGIGISTYG